jgi:hypothetical protein
MIITDNTQIHKTLEKISNKKSCTYYRILPTGELHINGYFRSHVFLAYVNGNWYASFGSRKSASIEIPENGVDLFVSSNNSLWIRNDDGTVDVASSEIPVDEGTCLALFTFSGAGIDVIMANGGKYGSFITNYFKKTPENTDFLAFTFAAFIRQFNNEAADQVMDFWFNKKHCPNDKAEPRPQVFSEKKCPSDAEEESTIKWQ